MKFLRTPFSQSTSGGCFWTANKVAETTHSRKMVKLAAIRLSGKTRCHFFVIYFHGSRYLFLQNAPHSIFDKVMKTPHSKGIALSQRTQECLKVSWLYGSCDIGILTAAYALFIKMYRAAPSNKVGKFLVFHRWEITFKFKLFWFIIHSVFIQLYVNILINLSLLDHYTALASYILVTSNLIN